MHPLVAEYFNDLSVDQTEAKADASLPIITDPATAAGLSVSSVSFLRADIRVFLSRMDVASITGRQLARILHGISSPMFETSEWENNQFWKRHVNVEFNALIQIATEEIVRQKQRNTTTK